jgi:lipoate-protein ligase A
MIFVDNERITDPAINLALEEHLLRHIAAEENMLLFYINEPSIVIGRNQNTLEEINREYVEENGIHLVRRLSGGGAVYHDLGNLNFSFITQNLKENVHNFRKFTEPVMLALQALGVNAELSGRNDLLVDGRKISGNAQYIAAKHMVSHGTLLFDSDLAHVGEALRVNPGIIESKGVKSVRSRVANICEFLPEPLPIETFRTHLLHSLFAGLEVIPQYRLGGEDWQAIHKLADERYRNWDWNWGRSPDFNIQKTHRFPIGEVDARIDVQNGRICAIKFFGDFLGLGDPAELEKLLVGVRYTAADLENSLMNLDVSYYFGGISSEEFLQFLY